MITVTIRQSGGAEIVSIPKAIGKTLGLEVGSQLNLTIEDNKIILAPVEEVASLDDLLAASPKSAFKVTEEDREWLSDAPVGKEL